MRFILLFLVLFSCQAKPPKSYRVDYKFPKPNVEIPPLLDPPRPGFVTTQIVEDQFLRDVLSIQAQNERGNTRYLDSCMVYNTKTENIDEVLQATNKFVNHISTESQPAKVIPVGNTGCGFKIDIRDYGLDEVITYKGPSIVLENGNTILKPGQKLTKWQLLERVDTLFFVSQTARNQNLQFQTQTLRPYVFVNSLMIAAMEGDDVTSRDCDVYCELVNQARDKATFFRNLGVNVQEEYDNERALYEANLDSLIAIGKSRGYELLESDDGFAWSSFDSILGGNKDHFETPFKLEAAQANGVRRSNKVFLQDAGERFYSLPNGCLGVRLENGAGNAEAVAPANVVLHTQNAASRIDGQIRLVDCVGCHNRGPIPFVGQIRQHVIGNSAFNAQEKDLVRVFSDPVRISATLQEITEDYKNQCLEPLGISDDKDPLNESVAKPFRQQLNSVRLCSYTYLEDTECLERLRGTDVSSQVYGNILNGGTISLATFQGNFQTFVEEMGLFKDVSIN